MKRCPICNTKIIMQDSARCSSCEAEKLRRELQVAQLAHFSTTNKKVEAEERYAEMAIECNVMLTEIADLRAKLQTAEQQLGQVREEVKRLTEALESTHMGRAVVHWMRAYDSVKCSDDNDENCQILRIPKNLIPKGATLVEAYETAKQFVIIGTPESDDESHNCDAMGCSTLSHVVARVNKSPATPSDGCGKGRTDKERLDWLEAQKIVRLSYFFMRPSWEVDSIQTDEPLEVSGESLRAAIDKAMDAASHPSP